MTERTGHSPDPADPEGLHHAISLQGNLLNHQADAISQMSSAQWDLFRRLDSITQTLIELTGQSSNPAAAAQVPTSGNNPTSASVMIPENFRLQPEPFHGDVETCGGFLLQCQLIFQQAPRYYQSDHSRISLIVNSLRNRALQWAQAFLASHPITHLSFDQAIRRLLSLKQDFWILAVEAGWPDPALKGIFCQSLNEKIKDHLCSQPEAENFEDLVTAALRSDVRLRERIAERNLKPSSQVLNPAPSVYVYQPVTHESPSGKRQKRQNEGLCYYCGQAGHLVARGGTPGKKGGPQGVL
uniref:DUF4939 domain-containing protein n=1 Tax=Oryzias latipes TaxID=8090 RepID=A0A3P9IGT0_ORYLA